MAKMVRKRNIETVFIVVLFSLFAMSSLMVLLLGGNIYISTMEKSQQDHENQTCLSYIWTKVKYNDTYDRVHIEALNGLPALCLEEEYGGMTYNTWIYHYDGWVYELYCEKGLEVSFDDGVQIIKAGSLSFAEAEQGLIEITVDSARLLISPRGKGGVLVD